MSFPLTWYWIVRTLYGLSSVLLVPGTRHTQRYRNLNISSDIHRLLPNCDQSRTGRVLIEFAITGQAS